MTQQWRECHGRDMVEQAVTKLLRNGEVCHGMGARRRDPKWADLDVAVTLMTQRREPTVFVVDDDQAVRDSLRWLVESVGLHVETFASVAEFQERYDPDRAGCVVLDVRMPGASGIELQERLAEQAIEIPVIIVTGHADVPTAVRAMKAGAVDFIEKPFNDQVLLDHIQRCIDQDGKRRDVRARENEIVARYQQLTSRQRRVMELVAAGRSNKMVADDLGISFKTVEAHRAKVMEKMRAGSLAELVKMATSCANAGAA